MIHWLRGWTYGTWPWRIRVFVLDVWSGIYYGYPLCCVLAFAWNRHLLRDFIWRTSWEGELAWVPCPRCQRLGRVYRTREEAGR